MHFHRHIKYLNLFRVLLSQICLYKILILQMMKLLKNHGIYKAFVQHYLFFLLEEYAHNFCSEKLDKYFI